MKRKLTPEQQAHTPGPWKFGGMNTRHVYGPDGHAICTLAAFEDRFTLDRATVAANAALIARAPDLLAEINKLRTLNAELVAAVELLLTNFVGDRSSANLYGTDGIAADQARAALAKARQPVQ